MFDGEFSGMVCISFENYTPYLEQPFALSLTLLKIVCQLSNAYLSQVSVRFGPSVSSQPW